MEVASKQSPSFLGVLADIATQRLHKENVNQKDLTKFIIDNLSAYKKLNGTDIKDELLHHIFGISKKDVAKAKKILNNFTNEISSSNDLINIPIDENEILKGNTDIDTPLFIQPFESLNDKKNFDQSNTNATNQPITSLIEINHEIKDQQKVVKWLEQDFNSSSKKDIIEDLNTNKFTEDSKPKNNILLEKNDCLQPNKNIKEKQLALKLIQDVRKNYVGSCRKHSYDSVISHVNNLSHCNINSSDKRLKNLIQIEPSSKVTGELLDYTSSVQLKESLCTTSTRKNRHQLIDSITNKTNQTVCDKINHNKVNNDINNLTNCENKANHAIITRNKKVWVCALCPDKVYTAAASLLSHYRSHAGIKPFTCELCGNKFTRRHSLDYHSLIHKNESVFTCPTCGRGFRHPSHFKEHLRKHTGETPYTCSQCETSFKTRNTYKRHLKARHYLLLSAQGIRSMTPQEILEMESKAFKQQTSNAK